MQHGLGFLTTVEGQIGASEAFTQQHPHFTACPLQRQMSGCSAAVSLHKRLTTAQQCSICTDLLHNPSATGPHLVLC